MARKKSVHIPPSPVGNPLRGVQLSRSGKHAKGKQPRLIKGQSEYGDGTGGAFGGSRPSTRVKKTFRAKLLATANRIHGERSLKDLYADWRASMTPEELALARKLKVHMPADANGEFGKPKGEQPDVEFHDPADLPEASITDHPVDHIEPKSDFAVAIASLRSEEITAAADCFSDALTWALDVKKNYRDLVTLGRRALMMIHRLRPDLVQLDWSTELDVWQATHGFVSAHGENLLPTGQIFGRVLEWVRRGDTISAIGERLCLLAYVVRPAMMDSPTLATLGETMNKTRQAKDKLVQCLRDTFAGLKAAAMRGETTRTRCQLAHS